MSSTRTAGRRDSRPPGARTARTARTPRTAPRQGRAGQVTPRARPTTPDLVVEVAPDPEALPTSPPGPAGRARSARISRPRSPRHRILLACTAALAAGFFAVLLLNTVISQGAFRQHELEIELILLAEKEEALARAVQQAEAPREVEKAARKLGMVPAASPVFLRLSDGKVLGEPVPAPEPAAPVDFAGAPGIQPTPKPSPSGSASTGAIDPALDPATGIDPARDPATGIDPQAVASPVASPMASPMASPVATAAASPPPVPTQQGVNP
ncbi:MAG TPA: hypothetical protein VES03_11785 [Motilibacterales bacterium]|nr:hypothetical protein [Motilibacterales bacterium]